MTMVTAFADKNREQEGESNFYSSSIRGVGKYKIIIIIIIIIKGVTNIIGSKVKSASAKRIHGPQR